VVGVITTRGGFTQKAYRQRVLIVRGSLNQPETHVVNVADILRGKASDFLLEPKDIVFVSNRPWSKVEDLLDTAISAFITTAVSTWTGLNVPNAIQEPVIPSL
jgi:polysaccharide export outer membrane protein